jgi:hypothetical protein
MLNMTHTLRTPAAAVLVALALAGFGLTACGESSGGSSQTSAAARARSLIARMRSAQSAATKAPHPSTGVGVRSGGPQHRHPPRATRFRQALATYAACLRRNGVNVPIPSTSGRGPAFSMNGVNTNSPRFRSATVKCRGVLLSAFRARR